MFNLSLNVRHAVRLAITGAAAAASTVALSQTAAVSSAPAGRELEEVIVTGTRIASSPNDISFAPIATLTSAEIAKTGLVRVEDLLNNLPQVIAEQGSGQSISSDGTATVSLRGLGSTRTLALINGRRMQPGAGTTYVSSADINQIPAAMVERVDVLTGGASATYGADAVAGVVNFIMNTHFEGVRLDFGYGWNSYGQTNDFMHGALTAAGYPIPSSFTGGQNRDWSFMAGSNFADGKGNATVYGTYLNTAPVVGYQLDYAGCTLNSAFRAPAAGLPWKTPACGGSGTSATGQFIMPGTTVGGKYTSSLVDGTVDKNSGLFRPYVGSGPNSDNYNYGALSYAQRGAERYTAGAFLNYDVNDNVNVYSETMYARNTSTAQYGPSGSFFELVTMSCLGNPNIQQNPSASAAVCDPVNIAANHLTFGQTGDQMTIYAARRSVESGGRLDNYQSNSIREVVGSKGSFADAWTYDVYGQYGITTMTDNQGDYLGVDQIHKALDVVTDPKTGQPACASAVNGTDPNCVPWNIWNKGGVTQAALNYLLLPSTYATTATEYVVNGSVTGDLGKYGVKLPAANDPVIVNIGTEYRQEKYDFAPDYVFSRGLASGGNGAATALVGNFHVNEYFMETKVPIADNHPGIYHLDFEGGYRYSTYSLGYNTNTYKLGLAWAPINDIKFRGSFNRAVRAPNIGDLYSPSTVGAGGNADPCWGATPQFTAAECALTGVTPAQYGHIAVNAAAQINTTGGGNPNLQPEKADTYTVGFVLQPSMLPGFNMSLDYYDIKIDQAITNAYSDVVLTNCAKTGDPYFCGKIHRSPSSGTLWRSTNYYVNTDALNIGHIVTKGFDLATRYNTNIGDMGKLNFTLSGTYVTDWSTQPGPGVGSYDCAGFYGASCGAPTPKWKHSFQTDWSTPWAGLVLTGRWRYTGPVDVDKSSSSPQLTGTYQPGFGHIGGYDYIDLSAAIGYRSHLTFRAGVNNVTDKGPPLVLNGTYSNCPNTSCNGNTWVGTYDTLGRYYFVHVSAKF
jgi:iron complex outermembrane receptor protein